MLLFSQSSLDVEQGSRIKNFPSKTGTPRMGSDSSVLLRES